VPKALRNGVLAITTAACLLGVSASAALTSATCSEASIIAQAWGASPEQMPPTAATRAKDVALPPRPSEIGRILVATSPLAPHGEITVKLKPWQAFAACFDGTVEPTLFLDHLPMAGLPTTGRYVVEEVGKDMKKQKFIVLTFRLDKPAKIASWNELLYRDWVSDTQRTVHVGVGAGGAEIVTFPKSVVLTVGKGSPSWAVIALVLCTISVILVAFASRALQDHRKGFQSVSLSRLMLLCWVATTTAVVIVVWRHSQALPSFGDGGLPFMLAASGLGGGFSTWLDTRRRMENKVRTSFLEDLLCDEDGLALHRLQSLIFNVVVLYVVWADLVAYGTVAQVDLSWATLLGASTLTYLFGRGAEHTETTVDPDAKVRPEPVLQPVIKGASDAVLEKIRQLRK